MYKDNLERPILELKPVLCIACKGTVESCITKQDSMGWLNEKQVNPWNQQINKM
jgi:hypothetical protein